MLLRTWFGRRSAEGDWPSQTGGPEKV
jgi:hypothetical protein